MSSRAHAGLILGDSHVEREDNAYLQRRIRVFYTVSLWLAVSLYVISTPVLVYLEPFGVGWGSGKVWFSGGRLTHLAAILATAALLGVLRGRPLARSTLVLLDAVGLYIACATCIAIFAFYYRIGPNSAPAFLALFMIARAVAVPSSARTTLLLSLPAPVALLIVLLALPEIYVDKDVVAKSATTRIIWHEVTLVAAALIAAVASHINFGLRHKARAATELGQYHLDEKLGSGSMGEVYRATHAMLRRPTAIKVIQPDATDPEMLSRFELEVRETSRLSHPNTISIYDYGRTADGIFYYAMEYLDGKDLREIVEESGPMTSARAIHVIRQACGALKEAHGAGLVHRDIKAGNIMLCRIGGEHDVVRVVDFGLVKDLRSVDPGLTQAGHVCGTPETIAPEVLRGADVTPAADLYALGVVAYYLLTKVSVFDAKTAAEYFASHVGTEPPPLRGRDASVPADLDAVVMRCLKKEPEDRYASAAEMQADLRACADAEAWSEEQAAAAWAGPATRTD